MRKRSVGLLVGLGLVAALWSRPALATDSAACLVEDDGLSVLVCERPPAPAPTPVEDVRVDVVPRSAPTAVASLATPVTLSSPPSAPAPAVPPPALSRRVSLVLPIQFQSQMREPSPASWKQEWTPYCGAASSMMVMREIDARLVPPNKLAHTFRIGRTGNTTDDPGLDPDGIAHLMKAYGGEGRIHVHRSRDAWLDDVIGRLNNGVAIVALTLAGDHAVTVYGYEAVPGGEVTALYVADPLSEHMGPVPIDRWFGSGIWMGSRFAAAGPRWQGAYVFVTYRDYR